MKTPLPRLNHFTSAAYERGKRIAAAVIVGAGVSLCCSTGFAATITLTDLATNSWVGNPSLNSGGGPYPSYEFAMGNLSNAPQRFQTLIKFDISGLSGQTLTSASLDLNFFSASNFGNPSFVSTVGVKAYNSDLGAAKFTAASYNAATISVGTFNVSHASPRPTLYSFDLTSALQYAIDQGFNYFSLQLNDVTADAITSAPYGPNWLTFYSQPGLLPVLTYTAVPEPSTYMLLLMGAVFLFVSAKRLRRSSLPR